MVQQQEEGSSSSVTSSPLQSFSLMSLSPSGAASPYGAASPWVRELKSDERGLYLIHLLINCANHVASGSLDHANAFLDTISLLASPDGDTMQRIASHFTHALARRILRSWPGLYRALCPPGGAHAHAPPPPLLLQARRHFLDITPFLRLAFLVSNQAIIEAMDGEKVVHVVDLSPPAADPSQWLALLQALSARPGGPPHLRITAVSQHKDLLALLAGALSEEAEKLDIPFQFNPVLARLDALDLDTLRVKTGEALAVSSALQLHSLLACEDVAAAPDHHRKLPPPAAAPKSSSVAAHLHGWMAHKAGEGTLGELLEKDHLSSSSTSASANGHSPPSAAADSGPPPPAPSARMDAFLAALWGLSPKIMVVAEQESNHNGAALSERFMEALNFYAALFDCLESTVPRQSVERARVEKTLFGEEISDIIACEGLERKERHEKLERWVQRLDGAGFGRVPLSYYGLLQARRLLQSFGCEAYKVKEEGGCFLICWQDRPMYSVSAWQCRRYD